MTMTTTGAPDSTPPWKAAAPALLRAAIPVNPDADYPVAQVLAWASMSAATLYRLSREGKGPIMRKRGRRTLVRGSDFLAWRDTVQ